MSEGKHLSLEQMPDEILEHIFSFLGKSYPVIRLVSNSFKVFYDKYYKGLKKILLLDVVVSKSLWLWSEENGCPWNEGTCAVAAGRGHIEVLQWAHENGCPWNEETCNLAAFRGHLEVLKWARENGCPE